MNLFGLTFLAPWALAALIALPVIWWLLRLTPPRPREEVFPPTRILLQLSRSEETPAQSPWWLTLLRMVMAALVILALAQPVQNAVQRLFADDAPLLIILDNTWSAGGNWPERVATAMSLVDEAEQSGTGIALALVADPSTDEPKLENAADIRTRITGTNPAPVRADLESVGERFSRLNADSYNVAWLTSGLEETGVASFTDHLQRLAGDRPIRVFTPAELKAAAITSIENASDALRVELTSVGSIDGLSMIASDLQGRPLGRAEISQQDDTASARFEIPVELRNEVVRIRLDGQNDAGAVRLLDESHGRRRVGLVSGANADRAQQPLLAPLYYISRALSPFTDIIEPETGTLSSDLNRLIEDRASMIVMADIGTLPDDARDALQTWIEEGGVLVRFAGSRLAGALEDPFTPVTLRRGGRNLGGTLSWETPQPVTTFNENGAFAGLEVPGDITVRRQVLAEPDIDLPSRTWAQLADGTPLVTADRRGRGTIILFHVTADTAWSNLPLSGTFVDMLRRIVAITPRNPVGTLDVGDAVLPPWLVLDGAGRLGSPGSEVEPLSAQAVAQPASLINPPGLYGTADGFVARNLFSEGQSLAALDVDALPANAVVDSYRGEPPTPWRPALLLAALALFIVDCLIVLWSAGALRGLSGRRLARHTGALALLLVGSMLLPGSMQEVRAQQTDVPNFEASLRTHLAYVVTGDRNLDTLSRKGLTGLTRFIAARTALEPGDPVGVDLSSNELAFYPLIYWPVSPTVPVPDSATMQRVDAFMKRGGTVLFDTRDQLSGGFGGAATSPATLRLREILAGLDVPALEPVPERHVLTRAFYLLDIFPGRYLDGKLWVEATTSESSEERPTQRGDGVSSIMITANDFAGAWAIERDGEPTLPLVPPSTTQRVYAYRTGVNIVMYMLTGNYKSDQVHVPALLERLGQ